MTHARGGPVGRIGMLLTAATVLASCGSSGGRDAPPASHAGPPSSSSAPGTATEAAPSAATSLLSQDPRLLPPQPISGVDPTTGASQPVGAPTRIRIPAIGVDAPLTRLARAPDGTMQAPPQWDVPGWYASGPRPGEIGPAVIAGHIDSTSGPAVFFRLRDLAVGAAVYVSTDDGRVLRFVVDERQTFLKARFPTRLVYGPQPVPVLRLVTCTGAFDASAGSYLSNLVVSAHLTT